MSLILSINTQIQIEIYLANLQLLSIPRYLLLKPEDQLPCHMTHTNEEVEKIVMETIHLNRHVQQEVKGPR